jgi:hypothetical protein
MQVTVIRNFVITLDLKIEYREGISDDFRFLGNLTALLTIYCHLNFNSYFREC